MTFTWRGKELSNYGKLGDAICGLKTPEDAADFWESYVEYLSRPGTDMGGKSPEEVARSNIGYLMGYYSTETRQRIYDLFSGFNVSHPIFGRSEPTANEAFAAGRKVAHGGT